MKSVIRRIGWLEEPLAPEPEEEPLLVIVSRVDRKLPLEKQACIQILREMRVSPWRLYAGSVVQRHFGWPERRGVGEVPAERRGQDRTGRLKCSRESVQKTIVDIAR